MMAINIANSLSNNAMESYLCTTRNEGVLKQKLIKNVGYLFLNRKQTLDIKAVLKLKNYIKKNEISIIHAHSSSYFIASLTKLLIPKVKLIWHDHFGGSETVSERKKQPLRICSNYFSAVIGVNIKLRNWSENNLKAKQFYYLPNFAVLNDVTPKTNLAGIEGKRIVCLAGFRPQNDHLNLLSAFKIIMKANANWTLHLVGNHYNDAYFHQIETFIQSNSLSDSVFLYHHATDIKNILLQTDIGVLSSKSEGLPVALLEYGLSKLPVIVTDIGECANVVINEKVGFLVPPNDDILLSKKLEKLILDDELRSSIGNNFYNHINQNYSEQKIIHKLLNIYSS